jgi:hypothetical protein
MTGRQVGNLTLWLFVFILGLAAYNVGKQVFPYPTQPPYTPTATLYPDQGYEAVTTARVGCFDWTNRWLTDIDVFEEVNVRGKNKDGTWYIVNWPKFAIPCWVQADLLNPLNFEPESLLEISESFPPPLTPTFTPTETTLATPTATDTLTATLPPTIILGQPSPTPRRTRTPRTPTPSYTPSKTNTPITRTATFTHTSTKSAPPTYTPTPTLTRRPTNTYTPTKTPVPPNTFTPTHTFCNRPAAPSNLAVTRHGQSPNIDLTWDSVSGAAEYEVFRSVNGGQFSSLGRTNRPNMDDSTRDDGTYRYYVIAINTCGESNRSNVLEISR